MISKLDQFYANLAKSGMARPSRFEVFITPPSNNKSRVSAINSPEILRHMTLSCESVELPSQTLATTEYKINGLPVIPLPYSFSYTNQITLTFKLSEDYRERNMFLAWQDLVYRPGAGFSYYNDYIGTIIVRPMNIANEVMQEFIFRNCFPITIQDLQYNWGSVNENLKQVITFSFFSMEAQTSSIRTGNFKQPFSGFPGRIDNSDATRMA